MNRFARAALAVCSLLATVAVAPSASAAPAVGDTCYKVWLASAGSWSADACDGQGAGTEGESRAIEGFAASATWTTLCLTGHVQNRGNQPESCQSGGYPGYAGTQGVSLRLEGVHIRSKEGPDVCAQAHVQDIGWQAPQCGNKVWVGTTGQGLRLEKIKVWKKP